MSILGLDGKPVQQEVKQQKDYSYVQISDVYEPRDYEVIIEAPKEFARKMKQAEREQKIPTDMDMVFKVVQVGKEIKTFVQGDLVMLRSLSMLPINLVSDIQFQINEDSIAGKVKLENHEEIRKFYEIKREKDKISPKYAQQMALGYDNKAKIPESFSGKDLRKEEIN